jgi:hypothetical protein
VPPGVEPIALKLVTRPAVDIKLDGVPVTDRKIELRRVRGTLSVGPAELSYRLGASGLLVLTLPKDGAHWRKDGEIREPGAQIRHPQGVLRLERADPSRPGPNLEILLKR